MVELPPCPDDASLRLEDLPPDWFDWYRFQYDPHCDAIFRARKAMGAEEG